MKVPLCHRHFPKHQHCLGSGCALWVVHEMERTSVNDGVATVTVPSLGSCSENRGWNDGRYCWSDPATTPQNPRPRLPAPTRAGA